MTTNRRRIPRLQREQFTPAALDAFRRMQELDYPCTCTPLAFADTRCSACKEWWIQHSKLHDELRCKLWDWPCVEDPAAPPEWRSDPEAQARWRALMEATQ